MAIVLLRLVLKIFYPNLLRVPETEMQMVPEDHEGWKLTDEGDEYAAKGSPEAIVFNLVRQVVLLWCDLSYLTTSICRWALTGQTRMKLRN
jgi:hypothetical protein